MVTKGYNLYKSHGSGHYIIALDPCFISKSGKATPGLAYFWSGQAGKAKIGLELLGFAAIDVDNHTAFHLDATQTLIAEHPEESLSDIYAASFSASSERFRELASVVVADAWFTKKKFIDAILAEDFHYVGRMRDDADLKYLFNGP